MFVLWLVLMVNMIITLLFAVVGAANVESQWALPGKECVWIAYGPEYRCDGNVCKVGETMSLGIDTNGDNNVDKTVIVNATYYQASHDPGSCPPPEWLISFLIFNLNLNAVIILAITIVVWSLVVIRIIVWVRDWWASHKDL